MSDSENVELFRNAGIEFRSVRLAIETGGEIRLSAQDMGPTVEQTWNRDDYEFWINVPVQAIARLAFVLLRDRYVGREKAVDEFRSFCEQSGIEHSFETWP